MVAKKQRKHVTFEDRVEVVEEVSPLASMTTEERTNRWYQLNELDEIRKEAMALARRLRVDSKATSSDNSIPALVSDDSDTDSLDDGRTTSKRAKEKAEEIMCTRGLERIASFERQRNKLLAEKAVLRVQEIYKERLAQVAMKVNGFARSVALAQGQEDFCVVYYPSLLHLMPEVHIEPFPLIGKSSHSTPEPASQVISQHQQASTTSTRKRCLTDETVQIQKRNVRHRIS